MATLNTLPGEGQSVHTLRQAAFVSLALNAHKPTAAPLRIALSTPCLRIERGTHTGVSGSSKELVLRVCDPSLSSKHAELQKKNGKWTLRDLGSRNGTWVNGEVIESQVLRDGDLFEMGGSFFVFRESAISSNDYEELTKPLQLDTMPSAMRTICPSWQRSLLVLRRVAKANLPVMVTGESGTGKELVAAAIHSLSKRTGQLIPVHCGAIAPNLIESELFGHKRGAFSGATADRAGLVEAAEKGTLFLDELAELPHSAQVVLLRVLQEGQVRPVGGTQSIAVDFRVVTATHASMQDAVAAGSFREDLYARLAGFDLAIPALRDRKEDLGLIIAVLLRKLGHQGHALAADAARALFRYHWPLNIRELEQALRLATAVGSDEKIRVRDLPESVRNPALKRAATGEPDLRALLAQHDGNVSAVARALSTSRSQVRRMAEREGIDLVAIRR